MLQYSDNLVSRQRFGDQRVAKGLRCENRSKSYLTIGAGEDVRTNPVRVHEGNLRAAIFGASGCRQLRVCDQIAEQALAGLATVAGCGASERTDHAIGLCLRRFSIATGKCCQIGTRGKDREALDQRHIAARIGESLALHHHIARGFGQDFTGPGVDLQIDAGHDLTARTGTGQQDRAGRIDIGIVADIALMRMAGNDHIYGRVQPVEYRKQSPGNAIAFGVVDIAAVVHAFMHQHYNNVRTRCLELRDQVIGGVSLIGKADALDPPGGNQIGGALQRHADETDRHLCLALAEVLERIRREQGATVGLLRIRGQHPEFGTGEGLVDAAGFGLGEFFTPARLHPQELFGAAVEFMIADCIKL